MPMVEISVVPVQLAESPLALLSHSGSYLLTPAEQGYLLHVVYTLLPPAYDLYSPREYTVRPALFSSWCDCFAASCRESSIHSRRVIHHMALSTRLEIGAYHALTVQLFRGTSAQSLLGFEKRFQYHHSLHRLNATMRRPGDATSSHATLRMRSLALHPNLRSDRAN